MKDLNDPILERDFKKIFLRYLFQGAIFDILGNLPIFFYFILHDFPKTEEEIIEAQENIYFTVCMKLKILRLAHFMQVTDGFRTFMDKLGEIFYLYRYMLGNLLEWILTGLKFIMVLHYFACGWIAISNFESLRDESFIHKDQIHSYIDAVYLTTQTITTVGYGDIGVKRSEETMLYLYFVTLWGVILFSSVTREIFNYNSLQTVQEIVKHKVYDMEIFLYELSARRSTKFLGLYYINECKSNIMEFV